MVRICLACGVVNPAGPTNGCPHLQSARIDGVDKTLNDLLTQVAEARRRYSEMSSQLKSWLTDALRDGRAEVKTMREAQASALEDGYEHADTGQLRLTNPEAPASRTKKTRQRPRRARNTLAPVDPRQLDLLALSPPKGNA